MLFRNCLSPRAEPLGFESEGHILSVQSHVCRDYVGNRASSLVLQLLGHEVDVINTVSFASMYVHEGHVLSLQDFISMMDGLCKAIKNPKGSGIVGKSQAVNAEDLEEHDIPIVMSGYIGNALVLRSLCDYVNKWRSIPCTAGVFRRLQIFLPFLKEKQNFFVMDPVIGDNGRPYVSNEMRAEYRRAIAHADVITPNEYELNWVLGEESFGQPDGQLPSIIHVMRRINACHSQGPAVVFLTSCRVCEMPSTKLVAACSVRCTDNHILVLCVFPCLITYLGGTGDVLSGLFVDQVLQMAKSAEKSASSSDWSTMVRNVIGTLQIVITECIETGDASINVVRMRSILEGRQGTNPEVKLIAAETTNDKDSINDEVIHQMLRKLN
eukprot:Gregarina_sp_Poly_1__4194@NODE_2295_length_2342_cov_94_854066_g1455_i1_p1_GENE_NODE_2295_length_2342_cov_94_854066_g1455_i1NODE_2295_length_2342_cov_94_854066_g1455_i1_p1_ORF_typecomplete_len382_score43_61Phos_pyr_kin/PF08543_12/1_7e03Phos_pyr_kin/PF08543_12/4_4e19PfkB/PF00294_24/7_5e05_NODE_2295_length_2342_cov_94_854066_g1455_i111302275